jgi:hypothetical protein
MRFRTIMLVGVPAAALLAVGGGAAVASSVAWVPGEHHVVVQTVPHEPQHNAQHEVGDHGTPVSATPLSVSATVTAELHTQAVLGPATRTSATCSSDHQQDDARHATTAVRGQHVEMRHHNDGDQAGHA